MLDDTTPDFNLPFEVEIDALGYGVGAKSDSTTTPKCYRPLGLVSLEQRVINTKNG